MPKTSSALTGDEDRLADGGMSGTFASLSAGASATGPVPGYASPRYEPRHRVEAEV
jgi:hypothetical protein